MADSCRDGEFGPVVAGCPGVHDFTLTFEFIILNIVPSVLVLGMAILRIVQLRKRRIVVLGYTLLALKLVEPSATRIILSANEWSSVQLWCMAPYMLHSSCSGPHGKQTPRGRSFLQQCWLLATALCLWPFRISNTNAAESHPQSCQCILLPHSSATEQV